MVNKWDIYYCTLNPARGSKERGKISVLVVSNNVVNHLLPVLTVLPLSSFEQDDKVYPSEVLLPSVVTGLPKDSIAMIQQVRTVSTSRLSELVGHLEDNYAREAIQEAMRIYFEV
jgi:mRNA interferase MazF